MTRYHVTRPGEPVITRREALGLFLQAVLLIVGAVVVIFVLGLNDVH